MLKLSKEKWDEAAAHAMTAVLPDFRRRVWYPPTTAANNPTKIGLVFGCKYGAVQLKDAVSLAQAASEGSIKVIAEEELDPTSLDIVRELKGKALAPSLSLPVFTPLAALGPSRSLNLRPGAPLAAPAASVAAAAAAEMGRDPQGSSQPPPANHLNLAGSGSGSGNLLLAASSNPAPPATRGNFPAAAAESGQQLGTAAGLTPRQGAPAPSVPATLKLELDLQQQQQHSSLVVIRATAMKQKPIGGALWLLKHFSCLSANFINIRV
eukprot:gene10150-10308_t